jgi:hypothetical protein
MYFKILSSYSLALLFDEKIRQSAALFWFGLRVVGKCWNSSRQVQRKFSVEHKLTHTQSQILINLGGGRGEFFLISGKVLPENALNR